MRRAAKVDTNHSDLIQAFRDAGVWVYSTAQLGQGFPDLLCAKACPDPRQCLVEIKDGSKPPSARKLTPAQLEFHGRYPGACFVVTSLEDVAKVVRSFFS